MITKWWEFLLSHSPFKKSPRFAFPSFICQLIWCWCQLGEKKRNIAGLRNQSKAASHVEETACDGTKATVTPLSMPVILEDIDEQLVEPDNGVHSTSKFDWVDSWVAWVLPHQHHSEIHYRWTLTIGSPYPEKLLHGQFVNRRVIARSHRVQWLSAQLPVHLDAIFNPA